MSLYCIINGRETNINKRPIWECNVDLYTRFIIAVLTSLPAVPFLKVYVVFMCMCFMGEVGLSHVVESLL